MAMLSSIEILCANINSPAGDQVEVKAISTYLDKGLGDLKNISNLDNKSNINIESQNNNLSGVNVDKIILKRTEVKFDIEYCLKLVHEFIQDYLKTKKNKLEQVHYNPRFGIRLKKNLTPVNKIKDKFEEKIQQFITDQKNKEVVILKSEKNCSLKFIKSLENWNLKKTLSTYCNYDREVYNQLVNLFQLQKFNYQTQDPILCVFYINYLINRERYKDASLFFIKKLEVLKKCPKSLLNFLTEKQITLIRAMFNNKNWKILRSLCQNTIINHKYEKFNELFIVQGIAGVILNDKFLFYSRMRFIHNQSSSHFYKAMAAFYLGTVYETKDNEKWLELGSKERNCLWSMLCSIYLKKKLNYSSIYTMTPSKKENNNYIHLKKAYEAYKLNRYRTAINHIYSYFNKPNIEFCRKSLFYLKRLCQTRCNPIIFQIGNLLFKRNGIILKEAFVQAEYVSEMVERKELSGIMSAYVSAIIGVETKYLDYTTSTLISECHALGVMQVAEKSALAICRKKGWRYSKNRLLTDHSFNIRVANGIILDHLRFCNDNILLSIICHNGGLFIANRSKHFTCLDLNQIHNVMLLNYMIIGPRSRTYLLHVFEHFIIYYFFLYNKLPSVNLISRFKHEIRNKKR